MGVGGGDSWLDASWHRGPSLFPFLEQATLHLAMLHCFGAQFHSHFQSFLPHSEHIYNPRDHPLYISNHGSSLTNTPGATFEGIFFSIFSYSS